MSAEFYLIVVSIVVVLTIAISYPLTYKYYKEYYKSMDKEEFEKVKQEYLQRKVTFCLFSKN